MSSTKRDIAEETRPLVALLVKRMDELRMSREDIGSACGVSAQQVSNWKSGSRMPDLAQLKDWAEAVHLELIVTLRDPGDLNALVRPETEQRALAFIVELVKALPMLNPRRIEALLTMIDTWKRNE